MQLIKKQIEADFNNLREAEKLPEGKKVTKYIKHIKKQIDEQVRFIGREIDPNIYRNLNSTAYKLGKRWLKKQGVEL